MLVAEPGLTILAVHHKGPAMTRKGTKRDLILDIAEAAVLSKGFAATSIEEIIAEAEITKGGFFYHFPDKNALALAMIERSVAREEEVFQYVEARARELTEDPLQILLIGLRLFAEVLENETTPHTGSILSSLVSQEALFDKSVVETNRTIMQMWEARLIGIFEAITADYEMADDIPLETLAGLMTTVMEGAYIYGRAIGKPDQRPAHLMAYRSYLKLLFHRKKG